MFFKKFEINWADLVNEKYKENEIDKKNRSSPAG